MRAKAAMPGTRWGYGAHSALEQMVQDTARRPGADRRDERITAGRKPR